ncbi:endopeptidase [bacteria symbiont BFo1 of Frankliniella occidentalis]|nr:endopeptidase [bacteria symbiont BFo1 of Frankliniella occidentalis]KYP84474.1 endopeptidase [bacteria symbiont BFo1 of Frankliniella occidentalis]
MNARAWLIIAVEFLAAVVVVLILSSQLTKQKARADTAVSLAKQRQETINDMQTRQRDVAALDAKYTKELADAQAETTALQHKLDNGGRVRVKGNCQSQPSTTSAPPSLGNDGTVELSSVAGRNVLSIRSGIQRDQSALRALQEYINTQCLK